MPFSTEFKPTRQFAFSPPSSPSSTALTTRTEARPVLQLTLREFVREAWGVIEPATPYVHGWHIDCMAEHLEAVSAGELRYLIINVPPRHMKSLLVSVLWPSWEWTQRPHRRWMFASYAESLSMRDTVKSRRLMKSPWYQERWGSVFAFSGDQDTKHRYDNDQAGYRIASSVGGSTGEGGDIRVLDDPNNIDEAESEVIREGVNDWHDQVWSMRFTDPATSASVIIQQRTHTKDVSGHLLEIGGYHHLRLPAEYEPRKLVTVDHPLEVLQPHDDCPIYADPRHDDNELLWPERFTAEVLAKTKRDLATTYAVAGQLQQRPVPRKGAIFSAEGFRPLPADFDVPGADGKTLRQRLLIIQMWDLAYSEKTSADWTASLTIGYDPRTEFAYLLNAWRTRVQEQIDASEDNRVGLGGALAGHIERLPQRPLVIGIWEGVFKRKAATHDLARRVLRLLATKHIGVRIVPVPETTDKVFRAQLPAGRCEEGMVFADRTAPWWDQFEAECLAFPRGEHDDWVDCFSGALALAVGIPNDQKFALNFGGAKAKPSVSEQFITIGGR